MHFWLDAARGEGGVSAAVNSFLNGAMPALTNSRVGSSRGTSGADACTLWPLRPKWSRNRARMSFRLAMARRGIGMAGVGR